MKVFFILQRFQTFDNATPNKSITGSNDNDSIKNSGALVKIYGNGGSDTIDNSANLVTISGGNVFIIIQIKFQFMAAAVMIIFIIKAIM